jgi:hypothetical protein
MVVPDSIAGRAFRLLGETMAGSKAKKRHAKGEKKEYPVQSLHGSSLISPLGTIRRQGFPPPEMILNEGVGRRDL